MRILVAGWHGQVARAISERLTTRTDVTAYAVGRPALDLAGNPGIGRSLFGIAPDVIINAAAFTGVDAAEDEPRQARRENAVGAANLAARAARLGLPIVHLSTAHVFDGRKSAAYEETDAPRPLNAFGTSKLEAEIGVAAANPNHVILRMGWIFSPFANNFVKSMLARAANERQFDVVADEFGSPTYALDLADAVLKVTATIVANPSDDLWGTYHVAGSGAASWAGLAQRLFEIAARHGGPTANVKHITRAAYQARSSRPANARLDCSKLAQTFGVVLPHWETGLEDCVARLLAAPPID